MSSPRRLDVIDIIKGIAIIMIVNVHLISGQFFPIGRTYHVIAFFFTAGLLHGITEKWNRQSLASFAKSRLKQLGHPYVLLSLCYILMHMVINIVRKDALVNIVVIGSFFKTITLRGIGTLWFLPVLFLGEIIFYGAKRRNIHSLLIVLLGVLAVFMSSYMNNKDILALLDSIKFTTLSLGDPIKVIISSLIASGFVAFGHLIYKPISQIFQESYFRSFKKLFILIAVCVASFVVDFVLIGYYYGDLHKIDIVNPIIYISCSLAGLTFVTSLALIIKRFSRIITNWMCYLGRNSLIIMTTHTEYYINSIANVIIVSMISMMGLTMPSRVISGFALLLIMLFEIGIIYIVNHSVLKRIFIAKK